MDRGKTYCTFTSGSSRSALRAAETHSKEAKANPVPRFSAKPNYACTRSKPKKHAAGRSSRLNLLLLLAACTSLFMLVFVFKLISSENTLDTVAVMRSLSAENGDTEKESGEKSSDEQLGRLQLVELPSLIQVFSPSDKPILPLNFDNALVDDSSNIARIYAPSGTEVVSVLPGTVLSVSQDGNLGGYVAVRCSGDIDIYYYGLTEICVERGQPVQQNSTLGRVANDVLCLRVFRSGRPIDPLDFLGIKAGLG